MALTNRALLTPESRSVQLSLRLLKPLQAFCYCFSMCRNGQSVCTHSTIVQIFKLLLINITKFQFMIILVINRRYDHCKGKSLKESLVRRTHCAVSMPYTLARILSHGPNLFLSRSPAPCRFLIAPLQILVSSYDLGVFAASFMSQCPMTTRCLELAALKYVNSDCHA